MTNNHKIVKQMVDAMKAMVNNLDKVQQEKVLINIDDDNEKIQTDQGPCKRTRGNMKKKVLTQSVDYKEMRMVADNMSLLEAEVIETLKSLM